MTFVRRFNGLIALSLLAALSVFADPPPNDAFSNRIAIVNSPTVVTGSLAGATFDPDSPYWWELRGDYFEDFGVTGSVWYTVAATNPCSVTIENLNAPASGSSEKLDVWCHLWWPNGFLQSRFWQNSINLFTGRIPYVTVRAYSSTNFDVQLTGNGNSSDPIVLRFTIHTSPLFIIPPESRTVSPGESVFFGVAATGHSALQYQWLHNGEAMPGETFPILSIDHITVTNAGIYRVIVSDDLGANSAEAMLTVSQTDVPPRWLGLERVSTNEWRGRLASEAGRSYGLEMSATLLNWTPVPQVFQETSTKYGNASTVSNSGIVFLRQTNSEVRFTSSAGWNFFRAVRYRPVQSECENNLKKLRFAKELWACEVPKREGDASPRGQDTPTITDLMPLFRVLPEQCPEPTNWYSINQIWIQPTCQRHTLLEPSW